MKELKQLLNPVVIVGALGYFVDMYDLLLFNIVRIPSLTSLGLSADQVTATGVGLINIQMVGMILGGLLFGVLGDRWGRTRALFLSIIVYSVATFLNSFVQSVSAYAVLRFIAGIGLAGELGCGVTLACETLPTRLRGYGTMLIASVGFCGALVAVQVSSLTEWRTAYAVGGGLGLLLLISRVKILDSVLFQKLVQNQPTIQRGRLRDLFFRKTNSIRFWKCVAMGLPIWFIAGILIALSPEIAHAMGVSEPVSAGQAVFYSYVGTIIGDVLSGVLSQKLQSRKKAILISWCVCALGISAYLLGPIHSAGQIYALTFVLGLGAGYWATLITVAAEQFGTALRATAATTVPNFIRGSFVLISSAFLFLKGPLESVHAALMVGAACLILSLWALMTSDETFGRDLDF